MKGPRVILTLKLLQNIKLHSMWYDKYYSLFKLNFALFILLAMSVLFLDKTLKTKEKWNNFGHMSLLHAWVQDCVSQHSLATN